MESTSAIITLKQEFQSLNRQIESKMEDTEESFEGRVLLNQQILNETYKVAKWKCQYIRLQLETIANPFSCLKNIEFSKLKKVVFWKDGIQTIQALNRFRAPSLESIYLNDNNIKNIEGINKIPSRVLKLISIANNSIGNAQCLSKESICLDSYKMHKTGINCVKFLVKLNFQQQSKKQILIKSSKRVNQLVALKALSKKLVNSSIWTHDKDLSIFFNQPNVQD